MCSVTFSFNFLNLTICSQLNVKVSILLLTQSALTQYRLNVRCVLQMCSIWVPHFHAGDCSIGYTVMRDEKWGWLSLILAPCSGVADS